MSNRVYDQREEVYALEKQRQRTPAARVAGALSLAELEAEAQPSQAELQGAIQRVNITLKAQYSRAASAFHIDESIVTSGVTGAKAAQLIEAVIAAFRAAGGWRIERHSDQREGSWLTFTPSRPSASDYYDK